MFCSNQLGIGHQMNLSGLGIDIKLKEKKRKEKETKDLSSIGFLEWKAKCLLWNVLLLFFLGFFQQ